MKRFWGFVIKEVYHIWRDKRTLLILFGMPLIQILLFGYAITNEIREARIAVVDQSHSQASHTAIERLAASSYFDLQPALSGLDAIEGAFRADGVKLVVVFGPEYGRSPLGSEPWPVQIIADGTDPNTASTLINYAQAMLMQPEAAPNGQSPPMQIDVQTHMRYNPQLKGVYLFVPGLITIILMLVSAMMTSISITREKEMGTMEVLLASPMRPWQIILGKVTPYIVLSLVNASLILLLGKFVFGVPIVGSTAFLMLESLLFILAALSLGILISTIAETQQVALLISLMALMLPTIMLSDFIFPIDNMPPVLQFVSNILPPRWFTVIVKNIMLKGLGIGALWKETLILIGFTTFFMLVAARKFKIRLE